jgi:transcriptional regulator with XRE-family HTH domain
MSLQRQIGHAIRAHRKLLSVSQEAFADRIGMHRAYYGALERGEKNLQVLTLARVAAGLGVRISRLLERAEDTANQRGAAGAGGEVAAQHAE